MKKLNPYRASLCSLLIAAFLAVSLQPVSALTPEEISELSQAGVEDEVIMRMIDQANVEYDLTVNDILELKENGVSDAVIQKMAEPAHRVRKTYPSDNPPQETEKRWSSGKPKANTSGTGELKLKNNGNRRYGVWMHFQARELQVGFKNSRAPYTLEPGETLGFRVPAGTYGLLWREDGTSGEVQVPADHDVTLEVDMMRNNGRHEFRLSQRSRTDWGWMTREHLSAYMGPDDRPRHTSVTSNEVSFYKSRFHYPEREYEFRIGLPGHHSSGAMIPIIPVLPGH